MAIYFKNQADHTVQIHCVDKIWRGVGCEWLWFNELSKRPTFSNYDAADTTVIF